MYQICIYFIHIYVFKNKYILEIIATNARRNSFSLKKWKYHCSKYGTLNAEDFVLSPSPCLPTCTKGKDSMQSVLGTQRAVSSCHSGTERMSIQ